MTIDDLRSAADEIARQLELIRAQMETLADTAAPRNVQAFIRSLLEPLSRIMQLLRQFDLNTASLTDCPEGTSLFAWIVLRSAFSLWDAANRPWYELDELKLLEWEQHGPRRHKILAELHVVAAATDVFLAELLPKFFQFVETHQTSPASP